MERLDRLKIYEKSLKKLLEAKNEDSFVIFTDPSINKFIQFILISKEKQEILCDIPFQELNETQIQQIKDLGFKKSETSYLLTGKLNEMVNLAEKIFINIFSSQENFELNIELNVEKSVCDACGKPKDKLQCVEVYMKKINKLSIPQEKIKDLIKLNIKLHEEEVKDVFTKEELTLLYEWKI